MIVEDVGAQGCFPTRLFFFHPEESTPAGHLNKCYIGLTLQTLKLCPTFILSVRT